MPIDYLLVMGVSVLSSSLAFFLGLFIALAPKRAYDSFGRFRRAPKALPEESSWKPHLFPEHRVLGVLLALYGILVSGMLIWEWILIRHAFFLQLTFCPYCPPRNWPDGAIDFVVFLLGIYLILRPEDLARWEENWPKLKAIFHGKPMTKERFIRFSLGYRLLGICLVLTRLASLRYDLIKIVG